MSTLNHPDKVVLDAYSDPQLDTYAGNGIYSRWTNQMKTPILNAKGIQLINANFINSVLQLNDASMLMFFYYIQIGASPVGIIDPANLRCIRLLPSTFVPQAGFTAYVRNKYFNNVNELVAALNQAGATGGDDVVYNPLFAPDMLTFTYDTTTRKISITIPYYNEWIAPASADDPNVIAYLKTGAIRMNSFNSGGAYATAPVQPYVLGVSMNARLGWAMGYNSRGLWANGTAIQGCANSTQYPYFLGYVNEADASPILLGSQNVNVYLSIVTGSGMDSWSGRKNLLASVPIEVAPLNINSYTTSSVEKPAISVPNEIYEIGVELFDDNGTPFYQPPNYNTELVLSIFY